MWRVLRSGSVWVGASLMALAACGESHRPTTLSPAGAGGSSPITAAGSGGQPVVVMPPSFLDSCAGSVPRSPLKRWSVLDLDRTLDALFAPGETLNAAAPAADYHYDRDLSPQFVDALLHVALARVESAVADDDVFEICEGDVTDEPTCVQTWIADWGAKLYRRPLTAEQVDAYVAQFRSAARATTPAKAARNVLVSMVLSPYFVLRLEMGDPKIAPYLASFEVAARLSHFGVRRSPDPELTKLAASNELRTAAARQEQLRRLWSSPEGQTGRVLTHLEWLGIRPANERTDLDADLRADMTTQVNTLVDDVLQGPTPTLQGLLTWSREPLNQRLAMHYGIRPPDGADFQRVDLEPTLFAGVLSTGAFLTRFRRPTARGIQVLEALLCMQVPPPPNGIEGPLPEGATPRARITAAVGQNPTCTGCHQIMDPTGFALEAFDDQGRLTGFDSSGALPPLSRLIMPAVANPGELGATIALSELGRSCAARRYLEFALDREVPVASISLEAPNPDAPGAPIPAPTADPDQRWLDCILRISQPPQSFDFTQVAQALVASNLFLARAEPSGRVVAFDTSVDPLEHAAQETAQFRGVFDGDDDVVIQQYQQSLRAELAAQSLPDPSGGAGGASGDAAGAAGDAAGAPSTP